MPQKNYVDPKGCWDRNSNFTGQSSHLVVVIAVVPFLLYFVFFIICVLNLSSLLRYFSYMYMTSLRLDYLSRMLYNIHIILCELYRLERHSKHVFHVPVLACSIVHVCL